jgi:hypothetical protein
MNTDEPVENRAQALPGDQHGLQQITAGLSVNF